MELVLDDVKTEGWPVLRDKLGGCLRVPKRHPARRRRDSRPGSCMERENLHGDTKGKAQVATTARPKVPMRRIGADCSVVVMKRGNARGAKGAGHRRRIGSTGNGRSPIISGRRQPSCDGTSRMNREVHVRICERLGVKFPGPTRQLRRHSARRRIAAHPLTTDKARDACDRPWQPCRLLPTWRSVRTTR
jgi:hypothetical protein